MSQAERPWTRAVMEHHVWPSPQDTSTRQQIYPEKDPRGCGTLGLLFVSVAKSVILMVGSVKRCPTSRTSNVWPVIVLSRFEGARDARGTRRGESIHATKRDQRNTFPGAARPMAFLFSCLMEQVNHRVQARTSEPTQSEIRSVIRSV